MGKVEYEKVDEIKNIKGVKKKHLTPRRKYDMIPKVITNGKVCRANIIVRFLWRASYQAAAGGL